MDVPLPRNPLEEATVKIARNRFKNVLKHMVQDNLMHDEPSDDSDNDENKLFRSGVKNSGASGGSKRMKVDGGRPEEKPKPHATFVMKLFDRGVDLAQFDEKTPLYPICRAWIHNKPQQNSKKAAAAKDVEKDELDISELEMNREEGSRDVYRLPPPEPLPIDEYGRQISLRVPPPLPRVDEPFDINYNEEDAPSPALLFQTHLDRWNLIRQRWREASAYNARRYQASIDILRQIHDSRVKQDEQAAANQLNQVSLESALQQQQEIDDEQQIEQEQLDQDQEQAQDNEQVEQEGQEQEQQVEGQENQNEQEQLEQGQDQGQEQELEQTETEQQMEVE